MAGTFSSSIVMMPYTNNFCRRLLATILAIARNLQYVLSIPPFNSPQTTSPTCLALGTDIILTLSVCTQGLTCIVGVIHGQSPTPSLVLCVYRQTTCINFCDDIILFYCCLPVSSATWTPAASTSTVPVDTTTD